MYYTCNGKRVTEKTNPLTLPLYTIIVLKQRLLGGSKDTLDNIRKINNIPQIKKSGGEVENTKKRKHEEEVDNNVEIRYWMKIPHKLYKGVWIPCQKDLDMSIILQTALVEEDQDQYITGSETEDQQKSSNNHTSSTDESDTEAESGYIWNRKSINTYNHQIPVVTISVIKHGAPRKIELYGQEINTTNLLHICTQMALPHKDFNLVWCEQDGPLRYIEQNFTKLTPVCVIRTGLIIKIQLHKSMEQQTNMDNESIQAVITQNALQIQQGLTQSSRDKYQINSLHLSEQSNHIIQNFLSTNLGIGPNRYTTQRRPANTVIQYDKQVKIMPLIEINTKTTIHCGSMLPTPHH